MNAERLYAWLLRAYPERFRARFGDDMRDTFSRDWADVSGHGTLRRARFWIDTTTQALWFGLAERREAPQTRGVLMRSLFAVDWRDAVRSLNIGLAARIRAQIRERGFGCQSPEPALWRCSHHSLAMV